MRTARIESRTKPGIANSFILIFKYILKKMMQSQHQPSVCGLIAFVLGVVSILTNSLTLPSSLCCRRDSVWRPSLVSVLSTQSRTIAPPQAPPWQMCRKSTGSLKSCRSLMRSPCLKKPWCALTRDTGATGRALSTMPTWQALGASVRAVPASLPPGASGTMNCLVTSPGLPQHPHLPF